MLKYVFEIRWNTGKWAKVTELIPGVPKKSGTLDFCYIEIRNYNILISSDN